MDLIKLGILCENCLRLMPNLDKRKRANGFQVWIEIRNPPGHRQICDKCMKGRPPIFTAVDVADALGNINKGVRLDYPDPGFPSSLPSKGKT